MAAPRIERAGSNLTATPDLPERTHASAKDVFDAPPAESAARELVSAASTPDEVAALLVRHPEYRNEILQAAAERGNSFVEQVMSLSGG